jgi:MFS family permease
MHATLLHTGDLALLGAISAGMLAAACLMQTVAQRRRVQPQRAQPGGLALLVGIGALVAAFPTHALVLVLTGAALAGAGLGLTYFGSQTEINHIAPPERRGEVTAAFITCQYAFVSVTAVTVGLLSDAASLAAAVRAVGLVIALAAVAVAAWHIAARGDTVGP